jgi:hypothetical protein
MKYIVDKDYIENLKREYSEKIANFSASDKFPERFYDIFDLDETELEKYRNVWMVGNSNFDKTNTILHRDEILTVKKVDEITSRHLYCREYNPIGITIMCPVGAKFFKDETGELLYQMKAAIYSIDDSSYGIWFTNKTITELNEIRIQIMNWLDSYIINGEIFLEVCEYLGGDHDSIDYN